MEKKVCEVKKIVLNIDGKEISLTIEQAKKLKDILGELFGKEIIKEVIREIHDNYPIYPWVYEPQTPLNPPWTITCGGTNITYSDNTRSINFTL
jgi:hypothetical protein